MEWWHRLLQDSIVGAVTLYGIKEGFPIVRMLLQEYINRTKSSDCPSQEFQLEILHKFDSLIEHEIKNLSEVTSNHTELYRLLTEKGLQNDEILALLNRIETTLQQVSLDLRLQQELFKRT